MRGWVLVVARVEKEAVVMGWGGLEDIWSIGWSGSGVDCGMVVVDC